MPKRIGNLFDAVIDQNNLLSAVGKAVRGRRNRPEARGYLSELDRNLAELSEGLRAECFAIGRFQQFVIRDPKERIITAPCFAERVLHHAVMNVCEPLFERWLIADTFACRAGKGRPAALARARRFARENQWFLSLDVRKYFDSIDHEVLLGLLARRFKDARLMSLFGRIIRSYRGSQGRGLPIGSLTSQHFANFYLDPFDRFVKESLRIRGYVRYMDDIAIWGAGREQLSQALGQATTFLADVLKLEWKPTPFVNRIRHGMDFLGVRLFATHAILNRRSRVRYRRRMRAMDCLLEHGEISETDHQRRATCLDAFARSAEVSSWMFRTNSLFFKNVGGQTALSE